MGTRNLNENDPNPFFGGGTKNMVRVNRTSRRTCCNFVEHDEYLNLPRPLIQWNSGESLKPWNLGSHQTTT